ncbi:MAG: fimbrillin family protein [Alistipes sp.]|jgi:uncharacterized protein (TIGR02145 family)|nr:fimbrillin family protein [Alistipes sp.]
MRKIFYLAILGVLAAVAMLATGCSKERVTETPAQAVRLAAALPAALPASLPAATRTSPDGDAWVVGDRIGVSTTGGAQNGVTNKPFAITNPATGALEPVDGVPLYYPQAGTVDFTAIYPWVEGTTESYTVGAASQTDALYARAAGVAASTDAVQLAFRHLMSKITLNVRAGSGVSSSEVAAMIASGVVFNGMPAEATFDLSDGSIASTRFGAFSPLKAASPESGAAATFTTILVPQPDGASGRSVAFTLGGETFSWRIPSSHDFDAGRHYVYPVTVNRSTSPVNPQISVSVGTQTIADWQYFEREGGESELIPSVVVGELIWAGVNVSTPGHFATTPYVYDDQNMYFWEDAATPANGTGTDGSICPAGWRMPTQPECEALMVAATNKGPLDENGTSYTSNPGWVDSEPKGMNVVTPGGTLFFAASGSIYNGSVDDQGAWGTYWTSTIAPVEYETRQCVFSFGDVEVHTWVSSRGDIHRRPIRCVRDR